MRRSCSRGRSSWGRAEHAARLHRPHQAVDETLRDWEHESDLASGWRRLAIDVRGALSVAWVVLRTGGGTLTAGDLAWMATRVGLPLAAIVAAIVFDGQQLQADLGRLPMSWWPLRTLAAFAQALGAIPVFLPPILFVGVLFPGTRRRVPWARAVLLAATVSMGALLVAQPWGQRVGIGLHYLTFAIERGIPVSQPSEPLRWFIDIMPIAGRVASAALASLVMAACAVVLRPRVAGSWIRSAAVAGMACVSHFVLLALPSLVQIFWRPVAIRSPLWRTWHFALAPLIVAVAAGVAAWALRRSFAPGR